MLTFPDSATIEVGVAEWLHAALVYPDAFAWVGGSAKVDSCEPSEQALADRAELAARAMHELFDGRESFDACWTHIECAG